MASNINNLFSMLGVLRVGLITIALLNVLLPLLGTMLPAAAATHEHNFWSLIVGVVGPVMAPLLLVVILFDYIMSRVRAADATGTMSERYLTIGRIELAIIGVTLLFWVPFFIFKMT